MWILAQRARRAGWLLFGAGLALVAGSTEAEDDLGLDPATAAPPAISEELGLDPYESSLPEGTLQAEASLGEAPLEVETSDALERAWRAPAESLSVKVFESRRRSLEVGAWNFSPAARSLIARPGVGAVSLDRARAAVELAPDLPAAHMALAGALWLEGEDPLAALRSVFDAAVAAVRHVEASFWFGGSALYLLSIALLGGGLLTMALAGISGLPHAAHDLGHWIPGALPEFARFALLAALLLLTLGLGEGLLGLALALAGVAALTGGHGHRVAMLLAALGVGLGAYPLARTAGAMLEAFPLDPVARAAFTVGEGLATPVELARLEAAAPHDSLAARALAIHARRQGRLAEADGLYQGLLENGARDVATLNNAANVRLDLGHIERALELYQSARDQGEPPVVLFNLAQAYGRGFMVEDLNRTFAHAQNIGGDLVARLTALQGTDAEGFVVDYPLSRELFMARALRPGAGTVVAAELRERIAPGRLGSQPEWLIATAVLIVVLGGLLGSRISSSRWCARCGVRVCPRCDPQNSAGEVCEGCRRLFNQPEKTDRNLRLERMKQLEQRALRRQRGIAVISFLVPGAAGLLSNSAVRAWLGAVFFALAWAAWSWRGGVVPDPLVAGAAGPVAFLSLAGLGFIGYALVVAASLAARRNR